MKSQFTEMRDLRLFNRRLQEILLLSFPPLFELEGIYGEQSLDERFTPRFCTEAFLAMRVHYSVLAESPCNVLCLL